MGETTQFEIYTRINDLMTFLDIREITIPKISTRGSVRTDLNYIIGSARCSLIRLELDSALKKETVISELSLDEELSQSEESEDELDSENGESPDIERDNGNGLTVVVSGVNRPHVDLTNSYSIRDVEERVLNDLYLRTILDVVESKAMKKAKEQAVEELARKFINKAIAENKE